MTVAEIERRMTARELAEWVAYTHYFQAIGDSWAETGLIVSALLAPHCESGRGPAPKDFIPTETPPQHEIQDVEAILALKRYLGQ